VQSKNFHVEAKPMLGDEEILLCIEPDGLTATTAGLTTTQTGQTTAQAGQIATQAGLTAGTQGAVTLQSRDWDVVQKIRGSQLLIIYEIQVRRSTKVFGVSLSSLL
jgi:hypothetical protein